MRSFVILIVLTLLTVTNAFIPRFRDVTVSAGINLTPEGPGTRRKLRKYGGPCVADLDGDGYYDLILVHHGPTSAELYFNNRNGTFEKSTSFRSRRDNHATTPFLIPRVRERFFTLVPGGNNGFRPQFPEVFQITNNRQVTNVVERFGVEVYSGRGRSAVFMPLQRRTPKPDVLYLNSEADQDKCPGCTDGQYDPYAYTGGNPFYLPKTLRGFNPIDDNNAGIAVDLDGDGEVELLTWRSLHLHKVIGFFKFKDITRSTFGDLAYIPGIAAVAEFDFDNDGDFDLYIARDKNGNRLTDSGDIYPDLLLENRGGRLVNIAVQAGIPQDTISRGVTVGDFNNDGYMDLYVTVLRNQEDMLLLNNGDSTFRRVDIGIGKQGASGDNAMAVDYDNDGRVDLVRSEGDWAFLELGGQFRILRNVKRNIGNYIKVRVGQIGRQTSAHAVVAVTANGKLMIQKVGTAGASIPHSYFDTLHFGIGNARSADVKVTWLNGVRRKGRVGAGGTATFGRY